MSKVLAANPVATDFRNIVIATRGIDNVDGSTSFFLYRRPMDVYLTNTGDATLSVTSIVWTTGTKYFANFVDASVFPFNLAPAENKQLKLRFYPAPGDEDTVLTDTLTINSDADNDPYAITVTGIARAAGSGAMLYFSPSSWFFNWINGQNFLAGTDIGLWSNVLNLLLINGGDDLLTIDAIAPKWPFELTDPLPQMPIVLAPGASQIIHIRAFMDQIGVVAYSTTSAYIIEVFNSGIQEFAFYGGSVTGLAITSVNTLGGTDKRALAAFDDVIKRFDPTNLEPERPALLTKSIDLRNPQLQRFVGKFRARYEDRDVASFSTIIKDRNGPSASVVTSIGSASGDDEIRETLIENQVTEQLSILELTHVSGELSFVDFPFVQSIQEFDTVVSVFNVTGVSEVTLAAFGSVIRRFDTSNLEPEQPAQLVKTFDLTVPHIEKLLAKLRPRYEDLGAASFKTTVKTRDETSTPITTTIGTGTPDTLIREALVDQQINEQVFRLTFDHVSGPLSFVDFGIDWEPRGPVVD